MINKSNDLPSFVNETNLPNIVDKLTDAKNIKISNNKYGNRVQTVIDKIVEKADDITKAIEQEVVNNSYSFKVGTGNVDVSTDVEDGFGEVGIKGVTYQNIFNNFSNSAEASKYITANGNTIKWTKSEVTTFNINIKYHNSLAQLGKTYTLVFYIYKNTLQREGAGDSYNVAKFNIVSYNSGICFIPVNKTGLVKVKLIQPTTTPSDGKPYLEVYKDSVGEFEVSYPILLEGDHTNNPNLPSYFDGIVGVGDKSKNLFNKDNIKQTVLNLGAVGSNCDEVVSQVRCSLRKISCKPNTKYTIKSDKEISVAIGSIGNNNIALGDSSWRNIYNSYTYTTPSDAIELAVNIAKTDNTNIDIDYVKNFNIQIEEGTKTTPYEHYYDGHKIEILSHGKNLYKPNLQTKSANGLTFSLHDNTLIVNGTCTKIVDFRPINGTESITLELYNYVSKLPVGTTLKLSNNLGLKNFFSLKRNGVQTYPTNTLIIQEGDYGISCFVRFEEGQSYNNAELKIQLEINNVATEYAPYVENKTQILLDEPLMRLPNGVCDEITRDGKLIRRVGKYVFDGSFEIYPSNTIESGKYRWCIWKDSSVKNVGSREITVICDKYESATAGATWEAKRGISQNSTGNVIYLYADEYSDASSESNRALKQWLSQNPVTVYYELSTPIVTELPAPYLRIFKDGHLTFNTLVAPESNHVVQLNKSGQIQNAIKESQSLDNRISILENNYDNLMLSTISRLNDLELNYKLK